MDVFGPTSKSKTGYKSPDLKSTTDGKVIKKFSKVLGQNDLVRVKNRIPVQILDQVEKELEKTMWNEYCVEYSPSSK